MKVTTKSNQPHTRTAKTPYTAATLQVNVRGNSPSDVQQRNQEMAFLALLVRVLNPQIPLRDLIEQGGRDS